MIVVADTIDFTPPAIAGTPAELTFTLSIPTDDDKRLLGIRMERLGVVDPDQAILRARLVEQIFELWPPTEAEAKAQFLHSFWDAEDIYAGAVNEWASQARRGKGARRRPRSPNGVTERQMADDIVNEVRDRSPAVRALLVQRLYFRQRVNAMLARIHIRAAASATSGTSSPRLEWIGELLTEATLSALHAAVGSAAWRELLRKINSFYHGDDLDVQTPA